MNEDISFEEAMEQLEQIANKLEKGDLNLDDSVKEFEKGMKLSKKCNEILEKAEKRITILIRGWGWINWKKFYYRRSLKSIYKRGILMNFFMQYKFIIVPFLTWFGIQLFKVFYDLFTTKKFNFKRILGAGRNAKFSFCGGY